QGDIRPPEVDQTPSRTYLAYGSSITHGNNSIGATGMFSRLTAEHLGVDFLNLGFGGGAHCEASLGRYIAGRDDWDFATLEMGINMVNWMDTPEFESRIRDFVTPIVQAHPDKWLFCIDMFPFEMDFDLNSDKNHTFRAAVRELVAELDTPKLVHIDGRDLLRDVRGLSADLLHPSPAGMAEIAQNLSARMQRAMATN
ncbi:MAG: SGNH/GDSL hydrolase family protein, partial [Anaerolineae bacterium]|nr:SGNH/GDSL hydrolase family protein [Anaerolineae bacterium]